MTLGLGLIIEEGRVPNVWDGKIGILDQAFIGQAPRYNSAQDGACPENKHMAAKRRASNQAGAGAGLSTPVASAGWACVRPELRRAEAPLATGKGRGRSQRWLMKLNTSQALIGHDYRDFVGW
ncbi:hypothetical protein VTI74DRAFT_123 [Chaetomium olivicolor]